MAIVRQGHRVDTIATRPTEVCRKIHLRLVIHRPDRQGNRGRQAVVGTVIDQERERVGTVVIGVGRVDQIRGRTAECTVLRWIHDVVRQQIRIQIRAAKRDGLRGVLVQCDRLRNCLGQMVDGHVNRDRGQVAQISAVVGAEGETIQAQIVGGWRIDQIWGGAAERSMSRRSDDSVSERVEFHVAGGQGNVA